MSINDPTNWEDAPDGWDSPPPQWEYIAADERYWWGDGLTGGIQYAGDSDLPSTLTVHWEVVQAESFGGPLHLDVFGVEEGSRFQLTESGQTGSGELALTVSAPADRELSIAVVSEASNQLYGAVVALALSAEGWPPAPCDTSYNCECGEDPGARTLADLRQELMVRLGYAAQVGNPPPGMVALLGSFLRDAQAQLYHRFTTFKTERFFTWPLEAGVRYYGLGQNNDCCEGATLDPYKISWVGVEDASGVWYPLVQGIPPDHYTMTDNWQGWPARYEVRECIEIFPAPSADMRKLRIKGHFGLRPFTEDEHKTTINADVLFLWALGTAKSHYGQPDAAVYFQQANDLIGRLVAGSHQTARYIPGRRPGRPIAPPKFLPISED